MSWNIYVLPGDGIGPEVADEAVKVLKACADIYNQPVTFENGLIGGAAIDDCQNPFPEKTLNQAKAADAIILGAVGGPKWEGGKVRPEQGLLALRQSLDLFANFRPAQLFDALVASSTLKSEVVSGLDLLIIRELTSGIYFGKPRAIEGESGQRKAFNTMVYTEEEIVRIADVAFKSAMSRNKKLCSVDKANVLEVSQLWRDVFEAKAKDYPEVSLSHMYVDNAAMQLVSNPKQFDVIATGNMFGDILSDCAAMLTGSIGMLASASLNSTMQGVYEPVHGSAPDIAGKQLANPVACILSMAEMCRYTFNHHEMADAIEKATKLALQAGLRTADIAGSGDDIVSTRQMGDAIVAKLQGQH